MKFLGVAPTSGTDLVTKSYADSVGGGGGTVTLSANNTFTGQNSFDSAVTYFKEVVVRAFSPGTGAAAFTVDNMNGQSYQIVNNPVGYFGVWDVQGAVQPFAIGPGCSQDTFGMNSSGVYAGKRLDMNGNDIINVAIGTILDENGNVVLDLPPQANAVNHIYFGNQPTGNNPVFGVDGSDPNIGLGIRTKGTGLFYLLRDSGHSTIQAGGSFNSGNVNLELNSQGTGVVRANGNTVLTRVVQTVTSTVTLVAAPGTDYVVFLGAGAVVTLPTAVGNTCKYTLKNIDTANEVISTTSSQTIDGTTTISIAPEASVDVISDGANWRVI